MSFNVCEVEKHQSSRLADAGLERPALGEEGAGHALIFQGWVVGRLSDVVSVQVRWETELLVRGSTSEQRPDDRGRPFGKSDR
jgi:hypothetical protein